MRLALLTGKRYGEVWRGMERYGEVWRGVHLRRGSEAGPAHWEEVWRGMERYGEVWRGMERCAPKEEE